MKIHIRQSIFAVRLVVFAALFVANALAAGAASKDPRKKLVLLMADGHANTGNLALPKFGETFLARDFRVVAVAGSMIKGENTFDRIEEVADADVLLVSVSRRAPPQAQLDVVRRYIAAGKPVVGIRTANHAFAMSPGQPMLDGAAAWPEWDAEVIGGNYIGIVRSTTAATITAAQPAHPILKGVALPITFAPTLYKVSPLARSAQLILIGTVADHPVEPAAWTFVHKGGGRTFYTVMGVVTDFENPAFTRLLRNAIYWAAGIPAAE